MPWRRGNRLPLLQENEASGRVAEVFDEVKAALGISYVPVAYQALALHPRFLDLQWKAVRPLLGTREFFEFASRLRAEGYTEVHNYFKVAPLGDGLTAADASRGMDAIGYVDSAMLLLLSVQMQAFDGAVGAGGTAHPADRVGAAGQSPFAEFDDLPARVRRVLDELRITLELPYVSEEQRVLATHPELLFAYWHGLKPMLNTAIYERTCFGLRESAWQCAQQVPGQVDLEIAKLIEWGVGEEEIALVARLSELLARGAAISLVNATFAKIGVEGGNGDRRVDVVKEERVA